MNFFNSIFIFVKFVEWLYRELEISIANLEESFNKWKAILDKGNSDEFETETYEIKRQIEELDADLEMLNESIGLKRIF